MNERVDEAVAERSCAGRNCGNKGLKHVYITFLEKKGWFCTSCAGYLCDKGLGVFADDDSDRILDADRPVGELHCDNDNAANHTSSRAKSQAVNHTGVAM